MAGPLLLGIPVQIAKIRQRELRIQRVIHAHYYAS